MPLSIPLSTSCRAWWVSRRTIYRCIERGDLCVGKIGKRTIIRRSDIDKLFELPKPSLYQEQKLNAQENEIPDELELITISEAQSKWGISESALYNLLTRENIQKMKVGKFVYVSKNQLEKIFN